MERPSEVTCAECGATAPDTETVYTLIGQQFAWRLTYAIDEKGRRRPEWLCHDCFKKKKDAAQKQP
jgi:hypothetical protein